MTIVWSLSVFMCFAHDAHGHDWCRWEEVLSFKDRTSCVSALHDQKTWELPAVRLGQGFGAARCAQKQPTVEK